jgi:hypothetical protein
MAHQPGSSGMPLVARALVVPLLKLAWWIPTRWQQGEQHTLAMQTTSDPTVRAREARAALAAFQAAERRAASGRHTLRRQLLRAAHLPSMAAAALEASDLDAAAAYAQQMLAAGMGPSRPDAWNAGNLLHHGHITLGRLALLGGDVDGAAEHLLRAGSTWGSPQLDSFGPDFNLADQLLARGRTDTVVDYLQRCQQVWKLGGDRLERWITEIHAGHRPTLDPFHGQTDSP